MNELKEMLYLLEERLAQHDENRKEVQKRAEEIRAKAYEEADSMEEKIISEIRNAFDTTEEHILSIIEQLSSKEGDELDATIEQAQCELSAKHNYEIKHVATAKSFGESYRLDISTDKTEDMSEHSGFGTGSDGNNTKLLADKLREHLDRIHESAVAAQDKVCEICAARRCFADELENKINSKLERFFTQEDSRLQATAKLLKEKTEDKSPRAEEEELETKARTTLFTKQRYELKCTTEGHLLYDYNLVAVTDVFLEYIGFGERKPSNVAVLLTDRGAVSLSFSFFGPDEEEVLKPLDFPLGICLMMWEKERCRETARTYKNAYTFGTKHVIPVGAFAPSTTYCLKVKIEHNGLCTKWSDATELTTPDFRALCAWKECPANVGKNMKYNVDAENPRIATKICGGFHTNCTITGNTFVPVNTMISWSVKILKSMDDGKNIYIGVAPFDINQNEQNNHGKCGWYLYCCFSVLRSGPPHNYSYPGKEYGPRKEEGEYVHEGDSVGVVMDTTKGELSFVLDSVNIGVAYEGIPLDKPLVPCVTLVYNYGDSVELIT